MMVKKLGYAALVASSVFLAVFAPGASPTSVTIEGRDWSAYGGNQNDTRYSPLDQINEQNVGQLGLAWHYDIDVGGVSRTTPIAIDGTLYFAAGQAVVHAMDAATGELLWKYDPQVGEVAGERLRGAWGSRGIAYANGQLFVGTMDGRLIALDAKTGKLAWSVVTVEKDDGRYITGAPWVFKDKVIVGHGGADFAPVRGYVTAYDQKTGNQIWRFYTVPGDPAKGFENNAMEMAAKTWTGEWWKFGGGGTVWNTMSYDAKYNRIYIGIGNGIPWNQKIRSPGGGDNLFLCSIVALDADTGEYVWHYQSNPGETWDYNATHDIEQADLIIDGKKRSVLLQAPKNGFFYLIDRETGKLISAENYVPVNWATGIDKRTGRPIEIPEARYPNGRPAIVYPSAFGAHGIAGMSFSPRTGLAYIPSMDIGMVYVDPPSLKDWKFLDGQRLNTGLGPAPEQLKPRAPSGALIAWNPVTQKEAWREAMAGPFGGGATATTAGNLLLQGRNTGQFKILAADSGKPLWSFDAQTAVPTQPITYLAKGRQYITVIAGSRTGPFAPTEWNYATQKWRVLTFALGAKAKLPPIETTVLPYQDDPEFKLDSAKAKTGTQVFEQRCATCHGFGMMAPDLSRSQAPMDRDAFKAVLHDGVLVSRGMPRFAEVDDTEIEALQHYIRKRARDAIAAAARSEKIIPVRLEGQ